MRRNGWIRAALSLFLALLCGCTGESGEPQRGSGRGPLQTQETAAPTGVPSPTPAPYLVLYGDADAAFIDGARQAAEEAGVRFRLAAEEAADGAPTIAAVAWLDAETDGGAPIDAYWFSADGRALPTGVRGALYRAEEAQQLALSAAIAYPPHCEPVRMLGLFAAEGSAGHSLWQAACGEGRIQSRAAYFLGEGSGADATAWLQKKLGGLYVGTIDAIYAENGLLATAAAEALINVARTDAEIFCGAADAEALETMRACPTLLVAAVGADYQAVGRIAAQRALNGEETPAQTPYGNVAAPEVPGTQAATQGTQPAGSMPPCVYYAATYAPDA